MSFGQFRPTREQVFSRLFQRLQTAQWNKGTQDAPVLTSFVTYSREIKLFSDVPAKQQPWVGQAEHSESSMQVSNQPYKRIWSANWIVYHKQPAPRSIPTNMMIDALERAVAPTPDDEGYFDERNTLSGLVWHCFIEGEIFKDPGDIDGQAMIVVPIKLLVP